MTPHACIPRALKVLDQRAHNAGLGIGLNHHGDHSVVLLGTGVIGRELAHVALDVARDFADTLATIDRDDPAEVIEALAQFWTHGVTVGAIAVAEGPR